MSSYAIVAEGITDQIVIQRMIEQLSGDDDPEVNFLQPTRDITDRHRAPHGGWELVFEFCANRFEDALVTNDYVVVQIDTDCGDHAGFGLQLTNDGVARESESLCLDVVRILADLIGDPLFTENKDRVVFAISVHSLESWLLLILYRDGNIQTGFRRLSRQLDRSNKPPLIKTAERYDALVKDIKRRRLMELVEGRDSLGMFLRDLLSKCGPQPAA